jgi:hypothetical protein
MCFGAPIRVAQQAVKPHNELFKLLCNNDELQQEFTTAVHTLSTRSNSDPNSNASSLQLYRLARPGTQERIGFSAVAKGLLAQHEGAI